MHFFPENVQKTFASLEDQTEGTSATATTVPAAEQRLQLDGIISAQLMDVSTVSGVEKVGGGQGGGRDAWVLWL